MVSEVGFYRVPNGPYVTFLRPPEWMPLEMPSEITTVDPFTSEIQHVENQFALLEDYVSGVITRHHPGLYIWGDGGIGKSYRVLTFLERRQASFRLHNSRMTAKGLFATLASAPSDIHVLEDMERITNDRDAQGVLRSALWSQPGHDRVITWTTFEGEQRVRFDGGLILIANRPLRELPELSALKTRINVMKLCFSQDQLTSYMRHLAHQGLSVEGRIVVDPEDAVCVTEFVIECCREIDCPLDLRLQMKAYNFFLQFNADVVNHHWRDLIRASISEQACHLREHIDERSPEDRKHERRQVVRSILARGDLTFASQLIEYQKATGFSKADFCRRKREIESGEFD